MTEWYRQDFPSAPQGHALATDWGDSTFLAWEDSGRWKVQRVDKSGFKTDVLAVDDFSVVREQVETAKRVYANPSPAPTPGAPQSQHSRYVRAGVGALGGTVVGMLLGGLPGILAKHSALASVGAQVGGVVGAATGAVIADSLRKDASTTSVDGLKSKLLQ
jgi:hypothetical protein